MPRPSELPTDTQLALTLMDHVQSREVVTVTVPWPPAATNEDGVFATTIWHFSEVGDVIVVEVSADVQANVPAPVASANAKIEAGDRRRIESDRRQCTTLASADTCCFTPVLLRCRTLWGRG